MIKLESPSSGLAGVATLSIQASGSEPIIQLSADKTRTNVGGEWKDDTTRLKQLLTYISDDGPCELAGAVPEGEAIEMGAAWRVVAQVRLSTKALPAFQAGRVSREMVALELVRVVEVWSSPLKMLWKAQDWQSAPARSAGKTVDLATGRVA
ncbi:MAG TPA: hypothetical protein VFT72_04825 [Opitutaceae bacterium]|nr:hypothetical protein [Opitutaceae bacterium]